MLKQYFFLAAIFVVYGCNSDDIDFVEISLQACAIENPLQDLNWLRAEVKKRKNDDSEDARYCYISQVEFEGSTYFLFEDCNPLVNKIVPIYDCEGANKGVFGDAIFGFDIFKSRTIIFYPENTLCEFNLNE